MKLTCFDKQVRWLLQCIPMVPHKLHSTWHQSPASYGPTEPMHYLATPSRQENDLTNGVGVSSAFKKVWSRSNDFKGYQMHYLICTASPPVSDLYTVFHKIGTPLNFGNNFFKCWPIWMKITSVYSLGNLLSGYVVCNCIFHKYSLYSVI